jgi:4-oxalocrotonate tautomerase
MPVVSIKALAGVFAPGQKAEIIQGVTDAIVAVEGERMRPVTWVIFEDVPEGNWAMGGIEIEAKHVKAVQNGSLKLSEALNIE